MSRPVVSCSLTRARRPKLEVRATERFVCLVVIAVASVATALGIPASASDRAVGSLVPVGKALPSWFSYRELGALAPNRMLSFGVSLKPRDPQALTSFADSVATPGSPSFRKYLTPHQFAVKFGPSSASIDLVERDLRNSGLSLGALTANRLLIPVRGSVRTIEGAFHTTLVRYRLSRGFGWATTAVPLMPRLVARNVSAIVGLNNVLVPHSLAAAPPTRIVRHLDSKRLVPQGKAGGPSACAAASNRASADGGWTESEIAQAYGLTGLYGQGGLGTGETIAVLELEPYMRSDVTSFDRCFFGPNHVTTLRNMAIDGFNLSGYGSGESILDIEILAALAPRAAIDVYEAPNSSFGPIDAYNAMVSDDKANIISSGWGECETAMQIATPGTQQLENYIFEEAAAQGQTVFASAGDTGSDDCAGTQFGNSRAEPPYLSVDDPASQPDVVGVGGTSLRSDTAPLNSTTETVWNDGASGGGGGGGISNSWASPSWQAQSGIPGTTNSTGRLVPDVSATADEQHGTTIFSGSIGLGSTSSSAPESSSGWATIGGTSASAPIWAAMVTDIASGRACDGLPVTAGGRDLGFVTPELYAAASKSYASTFNNITVGNNDVFHLGHGYGAGPGFNLASGLGSPIITDPSGSGGLAASLCAVALGRESSIPAPILTGVAPAFGPTSGGNVVTLTGSGFEPNATANVAVGFGSVVAKVDAVSSTSVTVTVPPAALAQGSRSTAGAGAVDVAVTVADSAGSSTSPSSVSTLYSYVTEATPGVAGPSVTGIGPPAGNLRGGNIVTIWGSGFARGGTDTVSFGGVVSPSVKVVNDSEIKAVVPSESPTTSCTTGSGFEPATVCQVEVVVTNAAGTSATQPILPPASGTVVFGPQGVVEPTSGAEDFPSSTEYDFAPTPRISSISPNPTDGSTNKPVTISGSGFSDLTLEWVNFGPAKSVGSEYTKVLSVTSNAIVIAPPGSNTSKTDAVPLAGGVTVQSAAGLSNVARFFYAGTPVVSRLKELGGPVTGGTHLRIVGQGLGDATSVALVGELSKSRLSIGPRSIIRRSNRELTVILPPDTAGPVAVTPCSIAHCARAGPSADTFVYFRPRSKSLAAISPPSGPESGGTTVVLFGKGVGRASSVTFDRAKATATTSTRYPPDDPFIVEVLTPPSAVARRVGVIAGVASGVFRYRPSGPSAPQSVTVAISGGSVTLNWRPPLSDGGSIITSYLVVATTAGVGPREWVFSAATRSATVSGLKPGHAYNISIAAFNSQHGRGRGVVLRANL